MRIALVTNHSCSGKGGVADYCVELQRALDDIGNECHIISVNDPFLGSQTGKIFERQVRLSSVLSWPARLRIVRNELARRRIDSTCFQFVPYAYHPKGLPIAEIQYLLEMCGNVPGARQVMLHELVLGLERQPSLRDRLIGALQRHLVLEPVLRVASVVHTSNPVFASIINAWGYDCEVLPLFGTIPVTGLADRWLDGRINALPPPDARMVVGWFGSLYGCALRPAFIESLLNYSKHQNKRLVMIAAGRTSDEGSRLWRSMERGLPEDCVAAHLGELVPSEASQFLQSLDFGVCATPSILYGKSSVAAVMREHRVKVIFPCTELEYDSVAVEAPSRQFLFSSHPCSNMLDGMRVELAGWSAQDTAKQLVTAMN